MNLTDYMIEGRANKKFKPNQDIVERWLKRVLVEQLHMQIDRYGKASLGYPKCIMLARYAEEMGYPDMAMGFWKKAFTIQFPDAPAQATPEPAQERIGTILSVTPTPTPPAIELNGYFPEDMQPGKTVTMQPTDGQFPREHYIDDDRYWGQPKRDGNKIVVFVSPEKVWYQSRQLKLNEAPSVAIDQAFRAIKCGSFIVEGEIYYLDVNGKEHMTGATCMASNVKHGSPTVQPLQKIMLFGCLWNEGLGHRTTKEMQIHRAEQIIEALLDENPRNFHRAWTARTRAEKQQLADFQKDSGHEGEVYFLKDLLHRPGKITSGKDPQFDGYVRRKNYLGIQRYRITAVAPGNAEGHTIAGFSIMDTDGNAVGTVGTGYTRDQQKEILRRFSANPDNTWVLVDAQTKTVYGQLRHAAFKDFVD